MHHKMYPMLSGRRWTSIPPSTPWAVGQIQLLEAALKLLVQSHDETCERPFPCEQADVILGEQQKVAGGLQAAQEGKVEVQADEG